MLLAIAIAFIVGFAGGSTFVLCIVYVETRPQLGWPRPLPAAMVQQIRRDARRNRADLRHVRSARRNSNG